MPRARVLDRVIEAYEVLHQRDEAVLQGEPIIVVERRRP
jgi:hypothetical protein